MSQTSWFVLGMLTASFAAWSSQAAAPQGDAYPLDTCAVEGEKLGEAAILYNYQGRELRFHSKECVAKFEAKPAEFLARVDQAIIEQQRPYYPLAKCPVSGDDLGDDAVDRVVRNRHVRLCCKDCVKEVEKDPAKVLAALDKAVIERDKPSYPMDTCVVSGEKLGSMGDPIDFVHANRLVRFCCKECVKEFRANPPKFTAKLPAAGSKKAPEKKGHEGHKHE